MFKDTLKLLSILLLLVLSFIYTESVTKTARESDLMMRKVINYKNENDIKPKEPIINGDEMILGYSGISVDKDKSYKNMKKDNKFDKNKIVYEDSLPKNTISKTYDYYIKKGNVKIGGVALIFKVNSNDNLDSLLSFIAKNNIKANFFVDGLWLSKNVDKALSISYLDAEIYNLGYDGSYSKEYMSLTNNIIESVSLKKSNLCLNENKNDTDKELCKKKKMHSITPSLVDPTISDVKEKLDKGIMISFDVSNLKMDNLGLIVKTITSRGYNTEKLSNLINEDTKKSQQ